jgi:lipopolysaccharide/colanic/teichoic acid biosynthesis glycosyltransferase
MLKRAFDVVVSLSLLIVCAPVIAALAIMVKHTGDPVLYSGMRIGRGGRPFRMHKFRTMVPDADRLGGSSTPTDDPRLTPLGQVLRRYKLDELPQLLNVFRGNMSMVGPRPEVAQYVDLFTEHERTILEVAPGITDWASLWNVDEGALLAGASNPDRIYSELIRPTKLRLQLAYVEHHSFLVDLKILVYTAHRLIRRDHIPADLNRLLQTGPGSA